MANVLSKTELRALDAYWRAANYLSVGQIYLLANPLLKEPLRTEHIKPRLLGHWGTTPGLNFIYVHLNRVIRKHDLNMIYISRTPHDDSVTRGLREDHHRIPSCTRCDRSGTSVRAEGLEAWTEGQNRSAWPVY